MKTFQNILTVAVIAVLTGVAVNTFAASLGVKFINDGNGGYVPSDNSGVDVLRPTELAGAPDYTQTNWNNVARYGQTVGLADSIGNASGVTISWDSPDTATNDVLPVTPNDKLMYSYLDALGLPNGTDNPYTFFGQPDGSHDNRPNVYAVGLNAWMAARNCTSYDVVVYASGNESGTNDVSEYWLQANVLGSGDPPDALSTNLTAQVYLNDVTDFAGVFTQVPLSANSIETAEAGNFIVFTNLSVDSFVLRSQAQPSYAPLNGIQIVPNYTIPYIDIQPQPPANNLYVGQSFGLSVVAAGPSLLYQWQKDGVNLNGASSANYNVSDITTTDSGNYAVVIANSYGSVTSSPVAITVSAASAPVNAVTTPASVTRVVGGSVTFTVTADGSTPFTYQWMKGATILGGQTNANLTLTNLAVADSAGYACAVSNSLGGTISSVGALTVQTSTGTSIGLNFTSQGETVTAPAFGIAVPDWTDFVNPSGSQSVGNLTVTWNSKNNWQQGSPTPPGDNEVLYGYLDDGNGGATVTVSGLAGVFGAYVIKTLGATDNGSGLQNESLTNGPQSLVYAITPNGSGGLTGVSSTSTTLHDDGVKFESGGGLSGGIRGGLAGILITDQPVIDQQPQGPTGTIYVGSSLSFTGADAFGVPGLGYQWTKNGSNITGATNLNYTNSAPTTSDSGNYALVVTNAYGSTTSSVYAISITASAPLNLAVSPASAAYSVGGTVVFTATADGSQPMSFQWYKGASPLSGQTNSVLTLENLQLTDAGSYTCAVSNVLGGSMSPAGMLTLGIVPPATMGINFTAAGESVTATALGVDPTNWINIPGPNNSVTSGSVDITCSASDMWQQGNPSPPGYNEVFYGYLDDGGSGASVTISGLASAFPVYVVQTLGATDNGTSLLNVTLNGSQVLGYGSPPSDGTGGLTGQSTVSASLYGDTLDIQGLSGQSGQARGGLAGVIITDQPVLEDQPQGPTNTIYTEGTFSITGLNIVGVPTLSYQWRKDGVNIPGATSSIYSKSNVITSDAGNYDVVVTNAYGSVTSSIVTISGIVSMPNVTVTQSGNNLILNWPSGTLLEATNLLGPWTTNTVASPYTVSPTNPQQFFRLLLP